MSDHVFDCPRQSGATLRASGVEVYDARTALSWHKTTLHQSYVNLSDRLTPFGTPRFLLLLFLGHHFCTMNNPFVGIDKISHVDKKKIWTRSVFFKNLIGIIITQTALLFPWTMEGFIPYWTVTMVPLQIYIKHWVYLSLFLFFFAIA